MAPPLLDDDLRLFQLVLDICPDDLLDPQRCAQFAAACARLPVVVVTDRGDVPTAVRALKAGAADVMEKPLREKGLLEGIKRAAVGKGNGGAQAEFLNTYVAQVPALMELSGSSAIQYIVCC